MARNYQEIIDLNNFDPSVTDRKSKLKYAVVSNSGQHLFCTLLFRWHNGSEREVLRFV